MTIFKTHFTFFLALLFLIFGGSAEAMPRLGSDRHGVILGVDLPDKRMVMRRADTSEEVIFTWNRRTVFIAKSALTDAASIKPGDRVEVRFHRPVFGSPFVTRVRVRNLD